MDHGALCAVSDLHIERDSNGFSFLKECCTYAEGLQYVCSVMMQSLLMCAWPYTSHVACCSLESVGSTKSTLKKEDPVCTCRKAARCWTVVRLHPPPSSSHQMVSPRIHRLRGCMLGGAANNRHVKAFLEVFPPIFGLITFSTCSTMWKKSKQRRSCVTCG